MEGGTDRQKHVFEPTVRTFKTDGVVIGVMEFSFGITRTADENEDDAWVETFRLNLHRWLQGQ